MEAGTQRATSQPTLGDVTQQGYTERPWFFKQENVEQQLPCKTHLSAVQAQMLLCRIKYYEWDMNEKTN